ncbi:MAG TPA: prolyl oligopeptidase family serine peptidase [Gemmatimonadales bacterium]|nr:prolyl oligopeptidase family serine peptidase [Gemmatimonadales bacterium]
MFAPRLALLLTIGLPAGSLTAQSPSHTVDQFLSPASPLELGAARKADVVAWVTYERGLRNVYAARGPGWQALRITRFLKDDGIDVGSVRLSADGSIAIFVRGAGQNRAGWVANPSHDPDGADRSVWAARTDGSGASRLASIANTQAAPAGGGGGFRSGAPELSPDGRYVVFVKDGQIYRASTARGLKSAMDTGGVPFIKAWGRQSNPVWSPDGRKLAFVSNRENHSFIAVYDMAQRRLDYLAPGVDFDTSPTWSPDGKRIGFIRKPGASFGQQIPAAQPAAGQPGAAAPARTGAAPNGCRPQPAGGFGGFGAQQDTAPPVTADGLCRAAFPGGYTVAFMVSDVATLTAKEFWHNEPLDRTFANVNSISWAGDHVVFGAAVPRDEWDRFFSVRIDGSTPKPVLLTTTDGLINDGVADRTFTTSAVSPDGKTFYYATNATDIEKRHIWAVPVAGGTPQRVSTDDGVEVSPTPLGSGRDLAVLYFDSAQPASIGIVPASGGPTRVVYPTLPKDFPKSAHVTPEIVITKAPDGLEIHNQLFLPRDMKPGDRRPAIVFVHGGPARQMLPAYHYMQFYHWAYAYNQLLQSHGYVVLSVNYRLGIGYGNSFRRAPNGQARGNAEYQDVLAGAKYLQSRPDVDPARIGIWGLSYGGLLTAQALARNSDVFVAGVDFAGVHIYGNAADTTSLAFRSSAVGAIDGWKSPVYLVHGDDDRNVDFGQTVGLVNLLRARNVYYELTVVPDDVHESMLHSRWMDIFSRSTAFLRRFVWEKQTPPGAVSTGPK